MDKAKSVFITGASSGLGYAMAKEFARRGYRLGLAARRIEKLEALRAEISQELSTTIYIYELDVTQPEDVDRTLLTAFDDLGSLDIVIANAGMGQTGLIGSVPFSVVDRMVATNITGVMATIEPAVRILKQQGSGQLVAISSVAGECGLPGYSATKAAVTTYMDALRVELLKTPIAVTTIAPGFIDTPINEDVPHRPFVIDAVTGGRKMVDVIESKKAFAYVPGWPWWLIEKLLRCFPDTWLYKAFLEQKR